MPFKVPGVWAEENPLGLAVNIPPVVIDVKPGVTPVSEAIPNPDEGMRRDILSPPGTLKLWNPETLSICLEHSPAASSEARHQ
jgi:hypothetical protein